MIGPNYILLTLSLSSCIISNVNNDLLIPAMKTLRFGLEKSVITFMWFSILIFSICVSCLDLETTNNNSTEAREIMTRIFNFHEET